MDRKNYHPTCPEIKSCLSFLLAIPRPCLYIDPKLLGVPVSPGRARCFKPGVAAHFFYQFKIAPSAPDERGLTGQERRDPCHRIWLCQPAPCPWQNRPHPWERTRPPSFSLHPKPSAIFRNSSGTNPPTSGTQVELCGTKTAPGGTIAASRGT